jgi:hypothetical protein
VLYGCGLQDQNCPGFTGSADEQTFFTNFCVPACNNTPALTSVVDPNNCEQTVEIVTNVSADFQQWCFNGFPQPG